MSDKPILLIEKLESQIKGMYESHSLKCTQYEDRVSELEIRNDEIEEKAEKDSVEMLNTAIQAAEYMKKQQSKITELQIVVNRLADKTPMDDKNLIPHRGILSKQFELNARIEYAVKHAKPPEEPK